MALYSTYIGNIKNLDEEHQAKVLNIARYFKSEKIFVFALFWAHCNYKKRCRNFSRNSRGNSSIRIFQHDSKNCSDSSLYSGCVFAFVGNFGIHFGFWHWKFRSFFNRSRLLNFYCGFAFYASCRFWRKTCKSRRSSDFNFWNNFCV